MLNFPALLSRMVEIFFLLSMGFFGRRKGFFGETSDHVFSQTIVKYATPCLLFTSVVHGIGTMAKGQMVSYLGIAFLWQSALIVLALLLARVLGRNRGECGNFAFMFTFGNIGIFGFSIIEPCFGELGSFIASFCNIAFNFFVFSVGLLMVQAGAETKQKADWKLFFSPAVILAFIGFGMCLLDTPCPAPVLGVAEMVGALALPLQMFTIGSTLCTLRLPDLRKPRLLLCALIRLHALPLLVHFVCGFFIKDTLLLGVLTILSGMPVGGMATTMNILYGSHVKDASLTVFSSTLLSLVTIPLLALFLL